LRAEEDNVRRAKACLDLLNARHNRSRLHNHASPPAIRSIVCDVVVVGGKVAQVVDLYLEQTPLLRPLQDTRLQRGSKHVWENGQNVYFHMSKCLDSSFFPLPLLAGGGRGWGFSPASLP